MAELDLAKAIRSGRWSTSLAFVGELASGWSTRYFDDKPTPFRYIGNAASLKRYVEKTTLTEDVIRFLAKRVSVTKMVNSLLTDLLNIPMLKLGKEDNSTILSQILEIWEKHDASKTLTEWFNKKEKNRAVKDGRYFTSVSQHFQSDHALFDSSLPGLDEKFITLEAAICHKSQLDHNPQLYDTISNSNCDWVMCDYPPVGMTPKNSNYKGELVFLKLDDGVAEAFSDTLPFTRDIGWFPYCTVAGYIDTKKSDGHDRYPTIAMSLLFQRRPKSPQAPEFTNRLRPFLISEIQSVNFLRDMDARVLLYYLVPSMHREWGISYGKIDHDVLESVRQFFDGDRGNPRHGS